MNTIDELAEAHIRSFERGAWGGTLGDYDHLRNRHCEYPSRPHPTVPSRILTIVVFLASAASARTWRQDTWRNLSTTFETATIAIY